MFTGVAAFQMGLVHIMAGMMGAGVFERHPHLRIGFGESAVGRIPYALHRMDFEFEDRFRDLMKLKPSEYWRRQCRATFQFDPIGAKLIDDIGAETIMWGSDYPHTDGIWPESTKYIDEQFAGLSPEVIHKITCENAAKFYRLSNCRLVSLSLTAGEGGERSEPGEGLAAVQTLTHQALRAWSPLSRIAGEGSNRRAIAFAKTSPDATGS